MLNRIKKKIQGIINVAIVLIMVSILVSCTQGEIIDYDLEIVETTEEVTEAFTFEKINSDMNKKSNIVTKKVKDNVTNDTIKEAIKTRTRKPIKAKGIYLPSYVVNHLYDFLHVLFKDFMGNVKYN